MSVRCATVPRLMAGLLTCASSLGAVAPQHRETLRIDGVRIAFERHQMAGRAAEHQSAQAQAWARDNPDEPVVQSRTGSWRIVGQRNGGEFRTAQFMDSNDGVVATISSREWNERARKPDLPFGMPRNVQIVRTVETVEERPSVLQVVAIARANQSDLRKQLDRSAAAAGWRVDPALDGGGARADAGVRAWRREGDELMAVIGPARTGSTLLVHWVRGGVSERTSR